MIYVTAVRLGATGNSHEHITDVRWLSDTAKNGQSTTEEVVKFIRERGDARVRDSAGHGARVGVVDATPPYIRTYADGDWKNNLLSLPRF